MCQCNTSAGDVAWCSACLQTSIPITYPSTNIPPYVTTWHVPFPTDVPTAPTWVPPIDAGVKLHPASSGLTFIECDGAFMKVNAAELAQLRRLLNETQRNVT